MLQTEKNSYQPQPPQPPFILPDNKGWAGAVGILGFPPQFRRQFLDDLWRGPGYVPSATALQLHRHLVTTRLKKKQQQVQIWSKYPRLIKLDELQSYMYYIHVFY